MVKNETLTVSTLNIIVPRLIVRQIDSSQPAMKGQIEYVMLRPVDFNASPNSR